MNTKSLKLLLPSGASLHPGKWIEAGTLMGISPDTAQEVRAPVTGVIKEIYPPNHNEIVEVVLERRREYDETDHY